MKPSEIRLWVSIPVYGNWRDDAECLKALEAQTSIEFRVLIADDGSPDPPPDLIHRFRFADYIRWENRGFAENGTVAASEAIEGGATHLLFLNSDTSFPPTFAQRWIENAGERPEAILSPLIYWFDRREKVWFSGGKITTWSPFFRQRREFRETTPVDIATACAILIPVAPWRALGGFGKKYVTYYEDFDLAVRAKRMGVAIYVIPDLGLHVWHKVSGSYRGFPRWVQPYQLLTSSLIFIRIHYRGLDKLLRLALKCAHFGAIGSLCLPELPRPGAMWTAVSEGLWRPV